MNLENNNTKLIMIILFTIITINTLNTLNATDTNTTTNIQPTTITKTITKTITNYTQLQNEIENAKIESEYNYHINLKKDNYTITNPITWNTKNKKTKLTINGNGSIINGNKTKTFLKINTNTTIKIANMTIINTNNQINGAIENLGNLIVENVTFKNNYISGKNLGGAAIYNQANLTINNTQFINNTAYNGGAIYLFETSANPVNLVINNTNFTQNQAQNGACIYNFGAKNLEINNTQLTDNTAENSIIYIRPEAQQTTIINTKITKNNATKTLILNQAKLNITNTTINLNNATSLINTTKSILNIQKSIIEENNLTSDAIINNNSTTNIISNIFNKNYLRESLINESDGQTHIIQNNFTYNKSPQLFKSKNKTYKTTQNNTYTNNNLTHNTIKLALNKTSFNYDEKIAFNITILADPIYNTTINTGELKIKCNETIIYSQNITQPTCYIEKIINQTANPVIQIEYIDDINFTSSKIHENITITSPKYQIKLMAPESYNLDEEIKYNITIKNNGDGIGHNVNVENVYPNSLTLRNSSDILENKSWNISTINPGEIKILQISANAKKACDINIALNINNSYIQNTSKITHYISLGISKYDIKLIPNSYYYGDNIGQILLIKNNGNGSGYNISIDLKLTCDNETFYNKTFFINKIYSNESMIISDDTKITRSGNILAYINLKDSFNNHNNITQTYIINKPYLEFNNITTFAGSIINITATLKNVNINLSGRYAFKLNSKTIKGNVLIEKNKITLLNYHVSEGIKLSENSLDIIYNQGNLKQTFRNSSKLIITKKTVLIELGDLNMNPGLKSNISAKILDSDGNLVRKGVVVFKINYKSLKYSNGKTIYVPVNNGIATLEYMLPRNFTNKVYSLQVVYGENNMYLKNVSSSKIHIKNQSVVAVLSNSTYVKNKNYKISINLTTSTTFMPIYGGNYVVKINGKTIVDKTRILSENLVITTRFSANRVYNITICYSGNQIYNPLKQIFMFDFNGRLSNKTLVQKSN